MNDKQTWILSLSLTFRCHRARESDFVCARDSGANTKLTRLSQTLDSLVIIRFEVNRFSAYFTPFFQLMQ